MDNFNNTMYWVDRHPKRLSEQEFTDAAMMSYTDTIGNNIDKEVKTEYINAENNLSTFLMDLFLSKVAPNEIKLKYRAEQTLSKRESNRLNDWEREFIQNLEYNWQYREYLIKNKEELESLIRLSMKEKIRLKIEFSNSYFSSGFDLCLYFQNVSKELLTKYTPLPHVS